MIRNAMFGLSLIAFTAGSAFAGNVKHAAKTPVVAAVAGDAAKTEEKPAEAAPAKKDKKAQEGEGPQGREDRGQDRDEGGRAGREVTRFASPAKPETRPAARRGPRLDVCYGLIWIRWSRRPMPKLVGVPLKSVTSAGKLLQFCGFHAQPRYDRPLPSAHAMNWSM